MAQNGTKMEQKWNENGTEMERKWYENKSKKIRIGTKMAQK